MCLGVPYEVKKIEEGMALVKAFGIDQRVRVDMIENLKIGDYVIIHAGFAIERLEKDQAYQVLDLFRQMAEKEKEYYEKG